jgi:hypothetical protein
MGNRAGQQVFARKANKRPHFTVMAWLSAEGTGRPPMIVVPNLKTAKQILVDFQDRCLIT